MDASARGAVDEQVDAASRAPEMPALSVVCANCGAIVRDAYCGGCGQARIEGRLHLGDLAAHLWEALASLDMGLVRLLRGLTRHPARVYADYIGGARKRYMNPVVFLLLVEGVYITAGGSVLRRHMAAVGQSGQALAEAAALQADKLKFVLALPVIVLASWAIVKHRQTVAEVAVFWLFCLGFIVVIEVLGLPLQYLWPAQRDAIKYAFGWIGGLVLLWHVAGFFGARSLAGVLRTLAVVVFTLPVLNYAYRLIFYVKGFRPDMGLVATLRDSFGV